MSVMKKGYVFVMLVLLSLSLVSAHHIYYDFDEDYTYKEKIVENRYYPEEHRVYSKTTYIDYDNDKRYSTDEYKYGYSYRTTADYRDEHYPSKRYYEDSYSGDYSRDHDYNKNYRDDSKDYYYKYISHLREYQKKECYHEAPKNKLFYIRCP